MIEIAVLSVGGKPWFSAQTMKNHLHPSQSMLVSMPVSLRNPFITTLLEAGMAQLHPVAIGSTLSNTLCAHTPPVSPPVQIAAVADVAAVRVVAVLAV
ncbi:hypothetical protein LVJ82_11020 [Vitreoscilla massiliensis]|uniref:Uncharacterized protein n=1 Tax=Vitreoscilla massiliensis TaxID=1689272 RepID=A0ABY4E124_9NEIS|nr:hypothetical protein [Vitreoscilla massiliensis]UOO88023.1 hypothetical protein LVJ82_11020 [Vitreoscilla massiliensis]